MSAIVSRLDAVLDALPKEGMKAAVVLGIVERIRELADLAVRAQKLVECLGSSRGYCRGLLCNPNCARIYMVREGDTVRIGKFRSNAAGIAISPGAVKISTKGYSLEIRGDGTAVISIPGGIVEGINLREVDEAYKSSYKLKYVVRRVGSPLEVIVGDLQACARASAIVCPA
jgi:hypothetical protein